MKKHHQTQNPKEDVQGSRKSLNYPTHKDKLTLHSGSTTRVHLSTNEEELTAKTLNPNEEEASTISQNLGVEGQLAMHASRRSRVPLRSLLDESQQLWSSSSSFSSPSSSSTIWMGASCPWDSWEELTSALYPLCCVCMVQLNGFELNYTSLRMFTTTICCFSTHCANWHHSSPNA